MKTVVCGLFWTVTFPARFWVVLMMTSAIIMGVIIVYPFCVLSSLQSWACEDKGFNPGNGLEVWAFLRNLWVDFLIYRGNIK